MNKNDMGKTAPIPLPQHKTVDGHDDNMVGETAKQGISAKTPAQQAQHDAVHTVLLTVDGTDAQMTPKEYELLFYLAKNRGIALSRERLITGVWGYDYFGDDRTLDTHIKMLRQNLGPYRGYIVTLRSMGYKFEPPMEPQA